MKRRLVMVGLMLGLLPAGGVSKGRRETEELTQNSCAGVGPDGLPLGPGDKDYMHDCLHEPYKEMYKSTKCHCHTGYCRPTVWRDSPRGTEVKISGHWYTFSESARRERGQIPKELWPYPAHVCARPTGNTLPDGRPEQDIECVVINASG